MGRRIDACIVAGAAMLLVGCASRRGLMPTPTIYTGAAAKPLFTSADQPAHTSPVDLLYITNRAPESTASGGLSYTSERSRSMAFGSVEVEIGPNVDWTTLVTESTERERPVPLNLQLGAVHELGRFPPVPYAVEAIPGGIERSPSAVDVHERAADGLQAEVARRLAVSPRKEVVLFVHGYANTFEDAALSMADICHFLGREFVCAIFSWPAGGSRGLMAGYNVDRESGEFSVLHLKQAIRLLARTPGVERIHLIAHSRGTDVTSSALRELNAEAYMAGRSVGDEFKLANLVLLAPDMDYDVAATKIFGVVSDPDLPYDGAPRPRVAFRGTRTRITVYSSPADKALGLSEFLFGSLMRVGLIDTAALTKEQAKKLASLAYLVTFIDVPLTPGFIGHSYFVSDPDVSADLIAMLRYQLEPGDAGRPLELIEAPFWRISASD